jgi:hypothetical protein
MTVHYQRSTVHTTADLRAIADHAGSYFFSRDTMRFFKSRLLSGVYPANGHEATEGAMFYFVTSEAYGDDPRHYTVRRAVLGSHRDGLPAIDIDTVGEHHATPAEARRAARELIAGTA